MLTKPEETRTGRGQTQPIQLFTVDVLGADELQKMDLECVRKYYNKIQSKFNAKDKMPEVESRYLEALQKYIAVRQELQDLPEDDDENI